MSDRTDGGRNDGELPPDPWAGLAEHTTPPPPPPPPPPAGRATHPSVTSGSTGGHVPPPRRTLWHHPGVWVALLLLAGVLLVGALLEPGPSRSQPAPDAVTASAAAPGTGG